MKSPRILIIRVGALGDVFFALPAVSVLRAVYPTAELSWLVGRALSPILNKHPELDHIHTIDEKKIFGQNKFAALVEIVRVLFSLRRRYDRILLLHRDSRWTLSFRALIGNMFQLARAEPRWPDKLVNAVRFAPITVNEGEQVRELLAQAVPETRRHPWQISKSFWESFKPADSQNVPAIVLHFGGGSNLKTEFKLKRWPHWTALIGRILTDQAASLELRSAPIIIVGAPDESEQAQLILEAIQMDRSRIVNLVGKTDLVGLVNLVSNAVLFVGVDSGPLHIADAAGVPSLGIFGPTSAKSWGILGSDSQAIFHAVPCLPCYKDDGYFPPCPFAHRCMTGLSATAVFEALQSVAKTAKPGKTTKPG